MNNTCPFCGLRTHTSYNDGVNYVPDCCSFALRLAAGEDFKTLAIECMAELRAVIAATAEEVTSDTASAEEIVVPF